MCFGGSCGWPYVKIPMHKPLYIHAQVPPTSATETQQRSHPTQEMQTIFTEQCPQMTYLGTGLNGTIRNHPQLHLQSFQYHNSSNLVSLRQKPLVQHTVPSNIHSGLLYCCDFNDFLNIFSPTISSF